MLDETQHSQDLVCRLSDLTSSSISRLEAIQISSNTSMHLQVLPEYMLTHPVRYVHEAKIFGKGSGGRVIRPAR